MKLTESVRELYLIKLLAYFVTLKYFGVLVRKLHSQGSHE